MAEHRFCQYRECGCSIDHMRPNAKYCNRSHKARENKAREADPPGTTYPVGKPYKSETKLLRRRNRQGCGTRVYLTPKDVADVRPGRGSRFSVSRELGLKLQQAQRRLEVRGER